ncbi:sterol desaturase family protein [Lysobacter hankyongensis]|uniref:Sterol desaturase family protein n=1 Tax=Lysobacter hankyongensis TaxID=1176535 RepID=A0ABP9BTJ2_9GAMM
MATAETIMMVAIPGFFVLMAVELAAARVMGRSVYRLNDAINSIGLGVLSQVVGVFTKLLTIGIYAWVVERVALFALPADNAWVWIGALLLYDFCYYWLHRAGHEVGILWAAHVVHHQSERYNLSTALRQTGSGALFGWVFYLPLAVLGVPVEVFAVVAVIDLIYQYWIHTELVPKLGWFDRVFASPSNHRVHHAVNDRYLDRNYGGILILWDRLFGTFAEERDDAPPVYGTRAPLRSWNPLWANLEVYWALAKDAWRARRWRDKLQIWFAPPGWRPADLVERFPKDGFDIARVEYDPPLSRPMRAYALLHFLLLLALGVQFLTVAPSLGGPAKALFAVFVATGLVSLGALLEGRTWGFAIELLRLLWLACWPGLTAHWPGHLSTAMALRVPFASIAALSLPALAWAWWGTSALRARAAR